MKKRMASLFLFMLLVSFSACGYALFEGKPAKDITWEALLEANRLEAVFEQTDSFCVTEEDGYDGVYMCRVAIKDGELLYSRGNPGYTEDLRGRVRYRASQDETSKHITIMAPTADLMEMIDCAYGEELSEYQAQGDVQIHKGQYRVKLYHEDEEWGVVTEGYAYFDMDTLLLDRVDLLEKLGSLKLELNVRIDYDVGTDFAMTSYDRIVNAEDTVDLTIHDPDGNTLDITVDRDVSLMAYYPNYRESWSACWDEACTGRVDDLGYITGSHGDIYLCEGDIPDAPPVLSRVLERSTFEAVFKDSYDTYFQNIDIMDRDENIVQGIDLAWYMAEDAGLCLNFQIRDEAYCVVRSSMARDNAWYSWTEEGGYTVDFFDAFSYAEGLIEEYRHFLYEEQLRAPMEQDEAYASYYIPYEETLSDGTVNAYKYCIHPDSDYIERIEITRKDSNQNVTGYEFCYIGGNGPIPGERDVFAEVSQPSDVPAVKLTVVSPAGEKTYLIRKDAGISWKGEALYSDEACTKAVEDLSWISGKRAKVYVRFQ